MSGKIIAGSSLPEKVYRGKRRQWLSRLALAGILGLAAGGALLAGWLWPRLHRPWTRVRPAAAAGAPAAVSVGSAAAVDTPKTRRGLFQREIGPIRCSNRSEPNLSLSVSLQLNFNERSLEPELAQKEDYLKVLTQLALAEGPLETVEIPALRDTLLQRFNRFLKTGRLQDVVFTQFAVNVAERPGKK